MQFSKKSKYYLLISLLTLNFNFFAYSQLATQADSLLNKQIAELNFSGTLLLAKNGKIIFHKSPGFADLDAKVSLTDNTRFSIGSINKFITAALIMKLEEEGKLSIDATIDTYIQEFKIPNGNKITLKHLLTHSGGLGDYMGTPEHEKMSGGNSSIDELVAIIAKQPLEFPEPGSKNEYSNSGFIVLGKIIEKLEKKNYFQVLTDRIFKPYKINTATFTINLKDSKGFAKGYLAEQPGKWIAQTDIIPPSSDGGLFITAKDFLKLDQAIFNGNFISKESITKMTTPSGKGGYGLATIITKLPNGNGYGHNGGMPGYEADYRHFYIGRDEYTVIIFANRDRQAIPLLREVNKLLVKIDS